MGIKKESLIFKMVIRFNRHIRDTKINLACELFFFGGEWNTTKLFFFFNVQRQFLSQCHSKGNITGGGGQVSTRGTSC